jgi:hypothetical protein
MNIAQYRADVEKTLFTELGQIATIRNQSQSLDPQFGSYEGTPTDTDTSETIVIMAMNEAKQFEEFGDFNPKRFKAYFKYDSVIEDESTIIDSSNDDCR